MFPDCESKPEKFSKSNLYNYSAVELTQVQALADVRNAKHVFVSGDAKTS